MSAWWWAEHAWLKGSSSWRQRARAAGLGLACALACLVPYAMSNAVAEVNCKRNFRQSSPTCPDELCPNWPPRDNYRTDDSWVNEDFICKECGKGKYGSGCSCPFFTRRRKYRDESNLGTLWCTNSCKEMYENKKIVTDVEFKQTGNAGLQLSVLKKIKFQYETEIYIDGLSSLRMDEITQVVCDKCP